MSHTPLSAPDAIVRRRATRRFDPSQALDEATLKTLLKLATLAPSAFNLQPWRFLVVRSAGGRKRLRDCAYNQPKVTEAPVVIVVLGYLHPEATDLETILAEQVERGVISSDAAKEMRSRVEVSMHKLADRDTWALRSTMIAVGMLLVAAESLGIASAPMEGFDPAKVREAFGIPDDHVPCCLVALGYALEEKPFPGRLDLKQVCFEEHFGQPWTLGEPE